MTTETPILMSSQRYLDDETVEAKRANQDYAVTVSPVFEYEGSLYQVVIDGHHSLAAAKLDGVEPEITEATASDCDTIGLLDQSVELYLQAMYMDSDWYDAMTGRDIW